MRKAILPAVLSAGALLAAVPALAQDNTAAPAAADVTVVTVPQTTVIVAPDGFTVTQLPTVKAEQVKGLNVHDKDGNKIGEIKDVVVAADGTLGGVIADFAGYLGFSKHEIALTPDQLHLYKNASDELRAFVVLSKDELAALPVVAK